MAGGATTEGGDPWVLYSQLALADPTSWTSAQRALVAIGGLRTEVNNGGFDQYFFNSAGNLAEHAVAAALANGEPALADLVRCAIAVLGNGYTPEWTTRQDMVVEVDSSAFASLDAEFYDLEAVADLDDLMRRLAAAISSA